MSFRRFLSILRIYLHVALFVPDRETIVDWKTLSNNVLGNWEALLPFSVHGLYTFSPGD
jgi:hypothetical protein